MSTPPAPECWGAVVVYAGCLCSDGADSADQLPDACPGHGTPRGGLWINTSLRGGVATHHDCPELRPCPPVEQS